MIHKSFIQMDSKEKVEFFIQCQKLLVEFHPNSPFVCRKNNLAERLIHIKKFLSDYKGFAYQDDNVAVLYNKIIVSNPKDADSALKHYMYQPPDPEYNAMTIDFVAFKALESCMSFVRANSDPKIQYVLFVRHNQVKVYPTVKLLSNVLNLPVV